MTDTLHGDEPRETIVDSRLDPRARAAKSKRIGIGFAIVASLATLAVGVWLFLRVEEHADARRHVPSNAVAAARVDLVAVARFAPLKKRLAPLLDGTGSARAKKLAKATGVDPIFDLREVVFAAIDGTSWVAIVGGRIKKGKVVDGLAALAKEEGWSDLHKEGGMLVGPALAIAQAEDGAIVVGSDQAIVAAALPVSDEPRKADLGGSGDVVLALSHDALAALSDRTPSARALADLEAAKGSIALGDPAKLVARLEPKKSGTSSELAPEIEEALVDLGRVLGDDAGAGDALRAAKAKANGDAIDVTSAWPAAGLERFADAIAHRLE